MAPLSFSFEKEKTMRKVTLFIAASLDGYIADQKGSVAWLEGQDPGGEMIDSYSEFIRDIDTVIMGWNTYDQVATELSPEEWVYKGLQSYVITHRECADTEDIKFVDRNVCELVDALRHESGKKGIWICGGASIAQQLMGENLIDSFYISVIPTILGKGIRLFGESDKEIKLKLVKTQNYNGITDLVYERR